MSSGVIERCLKCQRRPCRCMKAILTEPLLSLPGLPLLIRNEVLKSYQELKQETTFINCDFIFEHDSVSMILKEGKVTFHNCRFMIKDCANPFMILGNGMESEVNVSFNFCQGEVSLERDYTFLSFNKVNPSSLLKFNHCNFETSAAQNLNYFFTDNFVGDMTIDHTTIHGGVLINKGKTSEGGLFLSISHSDLCCLTLSKSSRASFVDIDSLIMKFMMIMRFTEVRNFTDVNVPCLHLESPGEISCLSSSVLKENSEMIGWIESKMLQEVKMMGTGIFNYT